METNKSVDLKKYFYCLMKAVKHLYPKAGDDAVMHTEAHWAGYGQMLECVAAMAGLPW